MARKLAAEIISIPQSPRRFSTGKKFVEWVKKRMWTDSKAACPWPRPAGTMCRMPRKYRCEYSIRWFDAKTWTAQQTAKRPLQDLILPIYEMATSRKDINHLPFSEEFGASRKATWHIRMARRRTGKIRGKSKS